MREARARLAALLSLALACAGGAAPVPPAPADGSLRITISLEDVVAFGATDGERKLGDIATGLIYGAQYLVPGDELWFVVAGRDAAGNELARTLPGDDLFSTLFSESDPSEGREHDLPPQELWRGALAKGEWTELTVIALEHDGPRADDAEPGNVPDTVIATMRRSHEMARAAAGRLAAAIGPDSVVGSPMDVREALGTLLDSGANQLLGGFAIRVANVGGEVVAEWRALEETKDRGYSRLSRVRPLKPRTFRLGGAGAHYEAVVTVRWAA